MEDAVTVDYCVKCSIRTETKEFQNYHSFTETECGSVSDRLNRFAEATVSLDGEVGAFTLLCENLGVGCCIDKLNKNFSS